MYDPVADIERLIDAAKAAPSVLNTQPWLFQIVANDRINLRAQPERRLQHIDPEGRELIISCGAALFNLGLALRVTGHDPVIWLMPAEGKMPGDDDRAELEGAAWQEQTHLWLLHRHESDMLLADIKEANRKVNEDTDWRKYRTELRRYTNEPMLSRGLGIPPEALGPLPANGHVPYRDLGLEWHGTEERERQRFEKHTRLLALSTNTNTRIDWLRAGLGLQRVQLPAPRLNVMASSHTQPLEPYNEKAGPENPRLHWTKFPQMIMRVGYCKLPAAKTPRLDNDSLWEDLRT